MSNNKLLMVVLILLTAFLVACTPVATESGAGETAATATAEPAETPATDGAADAATATAVALLASQLGVAEADIQVVSAELTEFTDSCLGLGGPAESCLQAITPGWVIMLSAGGKEYEVRVDETGQQARLAPEAVGAAADPEAATAAAVALLASQLGVTASEIEMVSLEGAEFTDSCLGLGGPAESCLQALTPGWVVTLTADGQAYEVRTDETGQQSRVATEVPGGGSAADTVAAAAQEFLASKLGVALGDVEVVSAEMAEFTDSCLGLGGPAESCLQAITPGWIVMLNVSGQEYEVHTDETGQQVRVAG